MTRLDETSAQPPSFKLPAEPRNCKSGSVTFTAANMDYILGKESNAVLGICEIVLS